MDHEKKKRQKKKKNKQGKANQNHQQLNSDSSDVQNTGLQQTVMDSDRESISGAETSRSVEAEKSNKQAEIKRDFSQLQRESDTWHLKEAELEAIILQLQTEKNSWLQKEAAYEEKVNRLVEEASTLRSMGACFEEKRVQMEAEKVNLAQRENSTTETIASVNKENAKLRALVIELETSRNNISHENQQLKEHVSDLMSKIQDIEHSVSTRSSSEGTKDITLYEDMNLQLESAKALVAKLLSENEKLGEKVNILESELDQKTTIVKPNNPNVNDETSTTESSETDPILSSAENLNTVGDLGLPNNGMPADKHVNHTNLEGFDLNRVTRVSMESGEIVQISLNENDVTGANSSEPVVPLTDAPLIGAPFRLISFVARYVSGADLVQK